jgi:hypothetical protein
VHPLRLSEKGGEPLVAGGLGVRGVHLGGLGSVQGMAEHAYEIVVLVTGACCPLAGIHFPSYR